MAEDRPRGFGGDDDWFEGDDEWVDTSERAALGREAGEGAEEQAAPPPRRARRPLFSRRAQRRTGRSARRSPPATVAADETEERRDDPFTPARVPVPAERRSHRRDLPARVRRRQFGGLAAVALLVIAATALASSGDDEPAEPPALKRLVGQTIVAPLGKAGPTERLLRLVRRGRIGSVIAFPSDAATLQSSVEQLQQAAEGLPDEP